MAFRLALSIPALILASGLAGCGTVSVPIDSLRSKEPETTGSVSGRPLPKGLDPSDAQAIARAAGAALSGGPAPEGWANEATGSSGSLAFAAEAGGCRPFASIVTSVAGVHRYEGVACPRASAAAALSDLTRREVESLPEV